MNTKNIKNQKNISKYFFSKTSGFTLVELIIVITILAILATIAFVSFKNYSGNARDGNRLSTLKSIEKGLELYFVKTGEFPTPEGNILTGSMSGTHIMYSGEIGENISSAIKLNKLALDPTLGKNYKYGITANKQEYNLGGIIESDILSQKIIPTTYADNYFGQVTGNYKGYIKYSTGSYHYLTNVPSLIYTYSGSVTNVEDIFLEKNNVHFIIKKGENLPYTIGNKVNSETADDVVKRKTGKENAKFENIDISEVVNATSNAEKKQKIEELLGGDEDLLDSFGTDNKEIFESIVNGKIPQGGSNGTSGNNNSNPSGPQTPAVPDTYTVTFETNGGSAIATQTLNPNEKVAKPTDPTKTDYTFDGWYKDSQFTTVWNFTTDTVTANTTLYSKWKANCNLNTTPASNFTYSNVDGGVEITGFTSTTIKDVSIPCEIAGKKVVSIGSEAFYNKQLASVTIPDSVILIGGSTFYGNQLTSVTIPNNVISIGDSAFFDNQLISVTIPNSVTNIGAAAFNNNQLLDNQAFIYQRKEDGSVDTTTIVSYGGANKTPSIPNNVISISHMAFYANRLTAITIPTSVTSISHMAFYANRLTAITIPTSVTSMGNNVFSYNGLNTISSNITGWISGNGGTWKIVGASTTWTKQP